MPPVMKYPDSVNKSTNIYLGLGEGVDLSLKRWLTVPGG